MASGDNDSEGGREGEVEAATEVGGPVDMMDLLDLEEFLQNDFSRNLC